MMESLSNTNQGGTFFSQRQVRSVLLIGLLIAALIGVFLVIRPYLHGIILGVLFASLCRPIYRFVLAKTKDRVNLAAATTCILVAMLVVVPLISFSSILVYKGHNTFRSVMAWIEAGNLNRELKEFGFDTAPPGAAPAAGDADAEAIPPELPLPPPAPTAVPGPEASSAPSWKRRVGSAILRVQRQFFPNFDPAELQDFLKAKANATLTFLAPGAKSLFQKGVGLVVNFLIMLFVMFYIFRDGHKITEYLLDLSPLGRENEALLIQRIKAVTRSAVVGTGLTAVVQGILTMIAFAVVGIPWFFWGVLAAVASLIPVVGTAMVWVPCCLYLLIIGKVGYAIGLAVYCAVIVGMSDNVLRPFFMRGETGMSPLIAFFAILGGIQFFGLIGVIYGPLIFGVCAILLYIFKLETHDRRTNGGPDRREGDRRPDGGSGRRRRRPRHRRAADAAGAGGARPSESN